MKTKNPLRIGISSCLLGHEVRYNGDHKLDLYIRDTLGKTFAWIPVCPEVELGLGVPRAPIDLVQTTSGLRLFQPQEARDLSAAMKSYCEKRVAELKGLDLDGYIFKSKSPSCGIKSVKTHKAGGQVINQTGTGFFAAALMQALPDLPVIEESALNEEALRASWLKRVFAYHELKQEGKKN